MDFLDPSFFYASDHAAKGRMDRRTPNRIAGDIRGHLAAASHMT